jgi:hypothetical protein
MKNGLLLTLKQLIKLGVIKLKKKRRRRVYSTDKQSPFQKGMNPIDIAGMGGQRYKDFITATSSPSPQAYSDAMRLRDENRNFDTRLLEYKNQQQEQKLLLEDQQKRQQELQQTVNQGIPVVQSLVARIANKGYVDDDNVDVSQTFGSEDFITQRDEPPPAMGLMSPPPTSELMYQDIIESLTPKEPPQQLLKGSSESEWEDIPKKKESNPKRYITKKLKEEIENKQKLYPQLSKEEIKNLVLMETKSAPKVKRLKPKKRLEGELVFTDEL